MLVRACDPDPDVSAANSAYVFARPIFAPSLASQIPEVVFVRAPFGLFSSDEFFTVRAGFGKRSVDQGQ